METIGQPADLSIFAGGDFAKRLIEARGSEEFIQKRVGDLYPGFDQQVVAMRLIEWPKQRFTQGGYSCPGIGQVTAAARAYADAKGRLIFAGEHASPAYFGYTEGALQSGLRAAQIVAKESGLKQAQHLWEGVWRRGSKVI